MHDLDAAARRLRLAPELFETGQAMMRERLRREHPELSADQIETRLVAWLREGRARSMGDACGRRGTWPRAPR